MNYEFEFEWDPAKARQNMQKHRYNFRAAMTVFRDPNQQTTYDSQHSNLEDRWITIGLDANGILRVVAHTYEEVSANPTRIRIISARSATRSEAIQYERR